MAEIVNPYIAGAPVTEARMFFGREDVFQWIENSIAGQYADHILVIHGQRRVGKTSVLKQLGNRLPKRYIPVFFDLQGRTHTSLDRFLWWLAREIVRVLKQDRGIEVPLPEKESFTDTEYFENRFLPDLGPALGEAVLLLTFDEFDNLEETEVKEELARPLIDHLRRLMGNPGLNFIFSIGSSGRKLENMQAAYTEFFKTALYKKISFLTEEQTRSLISRPVENIIEYEKQAVTRIYEIAGGHPYFTQLTCHELFAKCQQTDERIIKEPDIEAVLDDVIERGTVNLKFVWDEASDIEKWSLAALAQLEKTDNRSLTDYLQKQRVRFSESDLTSGLLHLREKDILTPENRFVIHLLKLWLQKNRPIEQAREELTEVNPIANRYIEIGLEFKDAKLYEKAIESFQEALAVAKDNVQAQVNIALVYMDQKAYDKAIVEFEKVLTIDDEDVSARAGLCEAHLALGDVAMQKGRMRDAVQSYQRVLAINAEHTEARQRMAEISRQRAEKALVDGKDEEALSAFTEALRFTPEDPALTARLESVKAEKKSKIIAALVARSEKEAVIKNWEGAVKALEDALHLSPEDARIQQKMVSVKSEQEKAMLDGLLARADTAERSARWNEAIDSLNQYLNVKPDEKVQTRLEAIRAKQREAQLNALKAQARSLTRAEKFDDALKVWEEYAALEPTDQSVNAEIEAVKKAQALANSYSEAQNAISKKSYDKAVNLLKEIIIQDENYKDTSRLLAEAIELRRTSRPAWLTPAVSNILKGVLLVIVVAGLGAGAYFAWNQWGKNLANPSTTTSPSTVTGNEGSASNSFESIQTYLAATPPDFQEDFAIVKEDAWGQIAEGITITDAVKDGVLYMDVQQGTPKEKYVLQSPGMPEASDFAVGFDFYYEDGTGGTLLGVGFPFTGQGEKTNAQADIDLENKKWLIRLTDGSLEQSGDISTSLKGQWAHYLVTYSNGRLSSFLNDTPLGHADNITHSGGQPWIYAAGGQAKIRLDNVKFWNLGAFSSSLAAAPTPPPTATAAPPPYTWARVNSGQFLPRDMITAILIDPNDPGVIYIGTENAGIYKSIDGGVSWQPIHNGLGRAAIDTLIMDPRDSKILYAGTILGGVYKTTDGGLSWQEMNTGIGQKHEWVAIVVMDQQDSQHLYFTNASGLFETTDGGIKWQEVKIEEGCPEGFLGLVVDSMDGNVLYGAEAGSSACQGGVYKSTDGGKSWAITSFKSEMHGILRNGLWIEPKEGQILYVSSASTGKLWVSKDNGETWTQSGPDLCHSIVFSTRDRSTAYCGAWDKITKTTNGGEQWSPLTDTEAGQATSLAILQQDENIMFWGASGLFNSTDGGKTSQKYGSGLGGNMWELKSSPTDPSALFAQGLDHSIYLSPDGGKTWNKINSGQSMCFGEEGKIIYILTDDGIAVSNNNGKTWGQDKLSIPNTGTQSIACHPVMANRLYATYGRDKPPYIYYSDDLGKTWPPTTGMQSVHNARLFFDHDQGSIVYVVGDMDMSRSNDAGVTWENCGNPPFPLWASNSDMRATVDWRGYTRLLIATRGNGIVVSDDGCKTWGTSNDGLGSLFVNTVVIAPNNPDTVYAATDGGAYVSFDYGQTWGQINDGLLGATVVYSIVVDKDGNVYAATPYGIFKLESK